MPGLVPGIYAILVAANESKTWMAGPSPAMTNDEYRDYTHLRS